MKSNGKTAEHPQTLDNTVHAANFRITSSHQGFTDRQKNVFDQLNIAEYNTRNLLPTPRFETDDDNNDVDLNTEPLKELIAQESIFKKPMRRPPRVMPYNNKVPDYRKNPQKWTKYSLEDVKNEDMSDRANTAAALSFLKELEARKHEDKSFSVATLPATKIVFKKTTVQREKNAERAGFQSSKLIMPEYVVGQKIVKETKRRDKTSNSKLGREIKLDHLLDDDEGSDDE